MWYDRYGFSPSSCLSVCLSHSWSTPKRFNMSKCLLHSRMERCSMHAFPLVAELLVLTTSYESVRAEPFTRKLWNWFQLETESVFIFDYALKLSLDPKSKIVLLLSLNSAPLATICHEFATVGGLKPVTQSLRISAINSARKLLMISGTCVMQMWYRTI